MQSEHKSLESTNILETRAKLLCERISLTEKTIDSLQDLGNVLRMVHRRLINEGYKIGNGKFVKRTQDNKNEE